MYPNSRRSYAAYNCWRAMKQRCYDENLPSYDRYGGRGITVCNRWLEDFYNFLTDMGERPSKLHSIDRINNDGDYEPTNCRWATALEQAHNQRRRRLKMTPNRNSKSGFVGVVWREKQQRWRVRIGSTVIGFFKNIDDAIRARKEAVNKIKDLEEL